MKRTLEFLWDFVLLVVVSAFVSALIFGIFIVLPSYLLWLGARQR